MRSIALITVASALALPLACSKAAPPNLNAVIHQAVNDPARPAGYRAADPLRKPAQTLAFAASGPA